jgi:hypothetical protein
MKKKIPFKDIASGNSEGEIPHKNRRSPAISSEPALWAKRGEKLTPDTDTLISCNANSSDRAHE